MVLRWFDFLLVVIIVWYSLLNILGNWFNVLVSLWFFMILLCIVIIMFFWWGFLYCLVMVSSVFLMGRVDFIRVVSWCVSSVKFDVEIWGLNKENDRFLFLFCVCFVICFIFKGINFFLCSCWWIWCVLLFLSMLFVFLLWVLIVLKVNVVI